jgi:chaperonin cofactor prefoldin
MVFGYEFSDIFTLGNLIYTAIVGILTWWLKERVFQKQQLRSGDIDNEIKEAEQGLKEVELLRETINVYKEINVDLRQEVNDLRTVVKSHKTDAKKLEELEDKINELFIQLAVEKENSKKLLTENNELRKQYSALQKAHEELKEEFEAYKAKHK